MPEPMQTPPLVRGWRDITRSTNQGGVRQDLKILVTFCSI